MHGCSRASRFAPLVTVAVLLVALAGRSPSPATSTAAGGDADVASLQAVLEDARADLGVPGVSAAAVDDGELVWSGVAGDRRLGGDAVAPATRFVTASAGKTVTAAIVMRLVDAGELSLGDRLSEFVAGLRGARQIRIRHLLEHSSGLPDYLSKAAIYRLIEAEPMHEWSRDEIFETVRRLRFRPGTRVSYSNTNYIALGRVIEAATGSTVEAAFQRLVAAPLGIIDSSWLYDPSLFDEGAHPYRERRGGGLADQWGDGFVSTDFVGEVWTDGGLATTGADLARIANALVVGDLLEPSTRRRMLRFRERGFGLGLFAYRLDGSRIIGHDGLYDGFTAQHWTDLESGLTIAVLANRESRGPDPAWVIFKRLLRSASDRLGSGRE